MFDAGLIEALLHTPVHSKLDAASAAVHYIHEQGWYTQRSAQMQARIPTADLVISDLETNSDADFTRILVLWVWIWPRTGHALRETAQQQRTSNARWVLRHFEASRSKAERS